mmetsp:Transcript_70697/g.165788  ORF Transcript_70697/g.165788 Transcript_70697/m.165788 type:complete len:469 (+) Transcript_70697:69-1475(+)
MLRTACPSFGPNPSPSTLADLVAAARSREQDEPLPVLAEPSISFDEAAGVREFEDVQRLEIVASSTIDNLQQPQVSTGSSSRVSETKQKRRVRPPPQLTLAEAQTVGLVRPRSARIPGSSVLASSRMRRKRLCLSGQGVLDHLEHQGVLDHLEHQIPEEEDKQVPTMHPEPNPQSKCASKGARQQPLKPTTATAPRKKLVESDFTQPTESWMSRVDSEETLQERRHHRNRVVLPKRITSRETIRAAFKGKSLLEERWIGNLDDPKADVELSVPAVIAWLRRTELYKHTTLTHVEVLNFVQQILSGHEVVAVCNVAGRRSKTVSAIQFQAIIHWIAQHRGITFSECIGKLVRHPNERTRLEIYFEEFAHTTSYGFMTVYEFTKFCRAFGLFKLKPGRFVEGDVQFLFEKGGEGKAVDLEGFRRVLAEVAERVKLTVQELLHFLGEKDAERAFQEGMDDTGRRRKAFVST